MVRIQVSGSKLLITSMSTKVDKDITAPKKKKRLSSVLLHQTAKVRKYFCFTLM